MIEEGILQMRVLIVGDAYSIHTYNFIKYTLLDIHVEDIIVWDLSENVDEVTKNEHDLFYKTNCINVVRKETDGQDKFYDLKKGFERIKEFGIYDVCHLHFLGYEAVTIGLLVRKICGKLISNYWGSDWLRADDSLKQYQKYLLEVSDYIVTDSLQIYKQVNEHYQQRFKEKLKYIRFKMPVISKIQSSDFSADIRNNFIEKYHIPSDKIVVTCGYGASKAHNHRGIIKAIKNIPITNRRKLFVIIPMTYGKEAEYLREVKQDLEDIEIDFTVIEDYLSFTEVALLRLATDIFINVEPTDAYSSTMIEYSYCKKVVIIGKWLDYSELEKQGAYYEKVERIEDITRVLEKCIKNFDDIKKMFMNNKQATEKFQTDYDRNELWEDIYGEKTSLCQRTSLYENMESKIKKWVMQNKCQNLGIYGMGLLGGMVYQMMVEEVGANHIYAFDKSVSDVIWYSDAILSPKQMIEEEMDVVVVTPCFYMEEIKAEYSETISAQILTYIEWLEELEKIG